MTGHPTERRDRRESDQAGGEGALAAEEVADAPAEREQASPDLFRRYLAIVLDGLKVRRDDPARLPVRALSVEELEVTQESE